MRQFHDRHFPNESEEYRRKRDELLQAEMELRKRIEEVAKQRRKLPIGGKIKENYVFEEIAGEGSDSSTVKNVTLSELFEKGKQSLFIYSFMFSPGDEKPCTNCNSILDGLNGQALHIKDRINFAVVAKAPAVKLRDWGRKRGWDCLRLLSSYNNSYNADYFAESPDGSQWPAVNVFRKRNGSIHHFYNTELLYAPAEEGQNARHVDSIWPLWNVLDMTPGGRGDNWYPKFSYP